jgi:hypothetical protein
VIDVLHCIKSNNWHMEGYSDLCNEDVLWVFTMTLLKRMGLRMAQKVDDYPILNQLIWMGLDSNEGVITLPTLIL